MIFKLIELKLPLYLVKWFICFLSNRKFKVKINDYSTDEFDIECGVPQGAVLSPTLFSIYINDMPASISKNKIYSLLFADDLVYYYIYKNNPNSASFHINKHLISIEKWLTKWRLRMAPHKCNYLVFTNGKKDISGELELKLNGVKLNYDNNPTFLGIRFDIHLTFKNQVDYLKKTCIQRLNIMKILSHKSWLLNEKTLIQIYNVLIRSIIDYSAILSPIISATNLNTLQIIQNNALRIIFKKPLITRTTINWLHDRANLIRIEVRMINLRKRYIFKAIDNKNPLIVELIEDYLIFKGGRTLRKNTMLCDVYDDLIIRRNLNNLKNINLLLQLKKEKFRKFKNKRKLVLRFV